MINAIIIEDESLAAKRLESLIKKSNYEVKILTHLPSIKMAVKWFLNNPQPDLIFMDIHLEDGLSFSLFEQTNITAPVIFTTAFDEYTIKAFKVNSIDYLLKPINLEDLSNSLDKFNRLRNQFSTGAMDFKSIIDSLMPADEQYKSRFLVTEGSNFVNIEVEEVAYFYAVDKYTFVVTKDKRKYVIDYTLEKLEKLLNPKEFYRINRKFIVSNKCIDKIIKYSVNKLKLILSPLPDGDVFVSLEKYTDFKKWLDM